MKILKSEVKYGECHSGDVIETVFSLPKISMRNKSYNVRKSKGEGTKRST